MVIGGAAGSTSGGVKLIRAIIMKNGISWSLARALLPRHAIKTIKFGNRFLWEEQINTIVAEANLIIILWIIFLALGVAVLAHVVPPDYTLSEIIFEVASAQGNVGLSTGIANAGLSAIGKITLILNMWIGRLEIIPVLMLFRALFKGVEPI